MWSVYHSEQTIIFVHFADILNYFKMLARWNVETTCKFVQVYTENEFLRNMHSLISHSFIHSFIHSFTGAYSPGWNFGLPFGVSVITHIQTHGRTPLDEWSGRRRGLYQHRTTQETNSHAPSGIRTRDPSNQAAADLRLTRRGYWDRRLTTQ
jgi:hypothetical protein